MRSRVIFFSRKGVPIDEIAVSTKRSWMLNNIGECSFTMPRNDPKLIKSTVEFGNFILVINPNTNPWLGVLDTPRTWTRFGPRLTAYSSEILLQYMAEQDVNQTTNIVKVPPKLTGAAGSIYSQMIDRMNEDYDTFVEVGGIFGGGVQREETLNNDYLTHARALASRSLNDFEFSLNMQSNNTLGILANWYNFRGTQRDLPLEEGVNVQASEPIATEQGLIKNAVMAIGSGTTDSTRLGHIEMDMDSIVQYGPRRSSVTYLSVKEVATLEDNAVAYLATNAWPRVTTKVVCTDKTLWKYYGVGDVVTLILHNAGFLTNGTIGTEANTRVIGMQADDTAETMEILVNDWQGND